SRVFIHQAREQALIERTPVDANPHRFVVLNCNFDHRLKVFVVMLTGADVAGIDAVLSERSRTGRILLQQYVTVVVKIADDRYVDPTLGEAVGDVWNSLGGLTGVNGDPNEF